MITFKIGFLLAFSLLPKSPPKDVSDDKLKKTNGQVIEKRITKKRSNKECMTADLPKYVLNTGNPIGYAQIEYELIPKTQKLIVDLVYWKGVARVYVGEQVLTYRVKIIQDKIWIPIFIQHFSNHLSVDDLQTLYNHVVNFNISTNRAKLCFNARVDKTTLFYLKNEDVTSNDITVPVYTENPNIQDIRPKTANMEFIEDILLDCIYKPGPKNKQEITTRIRLSDPVQSARMNMIINKISNNEEMFFKEFTSISPPPATSFDEPQEKPKSKVKETEIVYKKIQKDKRKNKPEEKAERIKNNLSLKASMMQIKVPGEVLFTDPNISMYDLKNTNDILENAYVLLSVERLMTWNQKIILNPITVKIEKIENLDAAILKLNKFKSIFIRYNIPFIAQGKTLERPVDEKVRFNESHAHFTHTMSNTKFTEFFQSNRLLLEVCGVRQGDIQPEIAANIFGSEQDDQHLSRRFTPDRCVLNQQKTIEESYMQTEVLAVASYDLSSLLTPTLKYISNESCHHPDNLLFQKLKPSQFVVEEAITTNNMNLKILFHTKSKSPLTELSLLNRGTTVKMEITFAAPTNTISSKISRIIYNRIFLIVYCYSIATDLLREILEYNQEIGAEDVVPHLSSNTQNFYGLENEYITGFVVDNGSSFAFFLEGRNRGEITLIWQKFIYSYPNEVTVYFNTGMVFEERFYAYFIKLGGIYVITLQKPLKDILANEMFYIEGNVPLPCWKAMKKLDLLFRTTSMKDIVQYNLLPEPQELFSLDLEWGVPMRWNENQYKQYKQNVKTPLSQK